MRRILLLMACCACCCSRDHGANDRCPAAVGAFCCAAAALVNPNPALQTARANNLLVLFFMPVSASLHCDTHTGARAAVSPFVLERRRVGDNPQLQRQTSRLELVVH